MTDRAPALVFFGSRLLLRIDGDRPRLPRIEEVHASLGPARLDGGRIPVPPPPHASEAVIYAFDDEGEGEAPEGYRLDGLRVAYHALSADDFRAAGTARQKVDWYRTHRFCSRCGTPTTLQPGHQAMACPACGQLHFPRVAPAVIVLVQRGDEALLGRSHRFTPGVYSTLAGFVEPGESLEECVHREIAEEVGVRVGRLRYFGSQPHPFPHSLMVGFVADWAGGEIRIDPEEIEDARWFHRDALPDLPHPMSIARALIEDFRARTAP